MSAEDIKALVRRWFEAWNDGKVAVSARRRKSANFASRLKSEISNCKR